MAGWGSVCRWRRNNRGATLLELAVAFPVLALLVFGGLDFGRAILIHNALTNAAREGARYGIVHPTQVTSADKPDPDNIVAHVLQELRTATVSGTVTPTVTYVQAPSPSGTCASLPQQVDAVGGRSTYLANPGCYPYLRVDVSYSYRPMTPIVGNAFGSNLTLRASTTMAIE